jgi:putative DNA primase/helicase
LGSIWPSMAALVTNGAEGTPLTIHRTFLARDGGRKALVVPQKMMLSPCRGGAVRLADPGDVIMVGASRPASPPCWRPAVPHGRRGEAAARDCVCRWKREGRRVRIARAPRGMDFNEYPVGSRIEGAQ